MTLCRTILGAGLVGMLAVSGTAAGQAMPAAIRDVTTQVGGGYSFTKPDIGESYIKGFSIYADAYYHERIGLELDIHDQSYGLVLDASENTFLMGPVAVLTQNERFKVYMRGVGGLGVVNFMRPIFNPPHKDTYAVFGLGSGIEVRPSRHLTIRCIDIEQQWWLDYQPHRLTPFVTTVGAAYRF